MEDWAHRSTLCTSCFEPRTKENRGGEKGNNEVLPPTMASHHGFRGMTSMGAGCGRRRKEEKWKGPRLCAGVLIRDLIHLRSFVLICSVETRLFHREGVKEKERS